MEQENHKCFYLDNALCPTTECIWRERTTKPEQEVVHDLLIDRACCRERQLLVNLRDESTVKKHKRENKRDVRTCSMSLATMMSESCSSTAGSES
jgi:hypothetical protein